MKITLEFDYDDEREAREYLDAPSYLAALEAFGQYLRGVCKHLDPGERPDASTIREEFLRVLREEGVEL